MSNPKVAFLSIARTTFDIELANQVSTAARAAIACAAFDLCGPSELITDQQAALQAVEELTQDPPDLLLIFQATFADSTMLMQLADAVDAPLLLWAVPEDHTGGRLRLNSLCGINLAGHALTRAGINYDYLFTAPGDPAALEKIGVLAKAGQARNILRRARLGRVGENPDGFETCLFDPDLIASQFGLEVVQLDLMEDLFALARGVDPDRIDAIQDQLGQKVAGLEELDPAASRGTMSVYAGLKQLAEEKNLAAFAVRCWPEFFTELGCAACGAMSMMCDEMVPCSCEADINGTITQMILQSISQTPAFGTDMVSIDEERDALVVWHCGLAPLSMASTAERPGVTIHSNRQLPLLFDFTLKPGPVTVARLSESSGNFRLVIGSAEVLAAPKAFSGTSGLLRFTRPGRAILDLLMKEGLEHHISITYGEYTEELIAFAKLLEIPVLNFDP